MYMCTVQSDCVLPWTGTKMETYWPSPKREVGSRYRYTCSSLILAIDSAGEYQAAKVDAPLTRVCAGGYVHSYYTFAILCDRLVKKV